jgi:membrane-associated phospholipid phosphatase
VTSDPTPLGDGVPDPAAGADTDGPDGDLAAGLLDQFAAVRRFDESVDAAFDRLRGNPVADRAFYAITELGDFGLLWMLIGGVRALRGGDDEIEEFVRLAVTMGVESLVVNGIIKNLVKRERPVIEVERPHRLRIPLTTSFPSGHASSAMTAATLLGQGRRSAPLYYALGMVVASSRVYVRIHHASDVVAGLGVGLTLGRVALRLWPGPRSR